MLGQDGECGGAPLRRRGSTSWTPAPTATPRLCALKVLLSRLLNHPGNASSAPPLPRALCWARGICLALGADQGCRNLGATPPVTVTATTIITANITEP